MSAKRYLRPLGLLITSALLASMAWGYVLIKDSGGYVNTWMPGTIPMQVKLATSPALSDGTSQSASVVAAMSDWNAQMGVVQFSAQELGPAAYEIGNDLSEIVMDSAIEDEAFGANTLAVTISFRSGNERTESDIIFNTAWTWDSYRGDLRAPEDIRRVAIHELGHVLGLDHPDQAGQSVTAVMNSTASNTDALQVDDTSGVQFLYGSPGFVPANNNFASATAFSLTNGSTQLTGTNVAATAESGEPALDAADPGQRTVWWKWTAPGNGSMALTTLGSNFDTLLGVYTGGTVGALSQVALNDDTDPGVVRTSTVTFDAANGTTYFFAVDGWGGYYGAIVLNADFTPDPVDTAPAIVSHPVDRAVPAGQVVQFSVSASGNPAPTYRWQRKLAVESTWFDISNAGAYSGVATSTLTINPAIAVMSGDQFRCVATNSLGSATSNVATLTILIAPSISSHPQSVSVDKGNTASFSVVASGSAPLTYQWQVSAPGSTSWANLVNGGSYSGATASTLNVFTSGSGLNNNSYRCLVSNGAGTTSSDSGVLTVTGTAPVVWSQTSGSQTVTEANNIYLYVNASGTAQLSYQWQVSPPGTGGWTNLSNSPTYSNVTSSNLGILAQNNLNGYYYRCVVTNDYGTVATESIILTVQPATPPSFGPVPSAVAVNYRETLSLSFSVYGSYPMTFQWKKDGTVIAGATSSSLYRYNVTSADVGSYTLTATNAGGTATTSPIAVTLNAIQGPTITTQPVSIAVAKGFSANFSASATGSATLTYQWYFNGTAIAGATGTSYYISNVASSNAGLYTIKVSNEAGSVTSSAAELVVLPSTLPQISWTPGAITISATNNSFSFYPSVSGSPVMTYQWFKDGVAIPGATSQYLYKYSATEADAGKYTLRVSNEAGMVQSSEATVTWAAAVSSWLAVERVGDVVWFLAASPGRIMRYDLAQEAWLPIIYLSETKAPTAFWPTASGVFIAYGTELVWRDADLIAETAVATAGSSIKSLVGMSGFLYYADSTIHCIKMADRTAGPVSTIGYYSNAGFSRPFRPATAPGLGYLFTTRPSTSPDDILKFSVALDGKISGETDSPYHGDMAIGQKQFVSPDERLVFDNRGVVFRASDLTYAGSVGTAFDDLAFFADNTPLVLRGKVLSSVNATSFVETGRFNLSSTGYSVFARQSNAFVFGAAPSTTSNPVVTKVPATSLVAASPSSVPIPTNQRISVDDAFIDPSGVIHLVSRTVRGVVRWDTTTRAFLSTIPLRGAPSFSSYAPAVNRLVLNYNDGVLTDLDLGTDSSERAFATISAYNTARSLVAMDDMAFLNINQASVSADLRIVMGDDGAVKYLSSWSYWGNSLAWQSATRLLYSSTSYGSSNAVDALAISAAGIPATTVTGTSTNVVPPLRFGLNGALVLSSTGRVLSSSLGELGQLTNSVTDGVWLADGLYTVRTRPNGTELQKWARTTYALGGSLSLPGSPLRIFRVSDSKMAVLSLVDGYLAFHLVSNALALSGSVVNDSNYVTAPTVTGQLSSVTIAAGANASFTVGVSGSPTLLYFWQVSAPGSTSWTDLTNGGVYNGVNTATLSITGASAGMNGNVYRCVIFNSAGHAISDWARLTVGSPLTAPEVTAQPTSTTVAASANASFTVGVSGSPTLLYFWQVSAPGSTSWTDLTNGGVYNGVNTATLSITGASAGMNGNVYRCVIFNSAGHAISDWARLTVGSPLTAPEVTAQPTSTTVAASANASFTVGVSGSPTLLYFWQVSAPGSTSWTDLTNGGVYNGVNTATLSINGASAGMDGNVYRCVIFNSAGHAISDWARLTVGSPLIAPAVTAQPASTTVAASANASFTVGVSGSPTLLYFWQVSAPGSTSWTDLANGGVYSGVNTATLAITGATTGMNGNVYRCVIFNPAGHAISEWARLTVGSSLTAPTVTGQPASTTVAASANASFTVGVSGSPTLLYFWQVSAPGSTSWTDLTNGGVYSGVNTATLAITGATTGMNGNVYRCVIFNSVGHAVSEWARLTVGVAASAPTVTSQPASTAVHWGLSANFSVGVAGTAPFQYYWQRSAPGSASWTDLADEGVFSGTRTTTLAISSTVDLYSSHFRCVIYNSVGHVVSESAVLSALSYLSPSVTSDPSSVTITAGANTSFTIAITGSPTLRYYWQVSAPGSTSWTDLTNGGVYSGVNTATLTITGASAGLNGNAYRCVVYNETGHVVGGWARLTVTSSFSQAGSESRSTSVDFEAWRRTKFTPTELADPTVSGPEAVYGSDGLTNLTKYALGLEPKQNETGELGETFADETEWSYAYLRPAGLDDIVYSVEVSTDLTHWTAAGALREIVSSGAGWELCEVRYPRTADQTVVFRIVVTRR